MTILIGIVAGQCEGVAAGKPLPQFWDSHSFGVSTVLGFLQFWGFYSFGVSTVYYCTKHLIPTTTLVISTEAPPWWGNYMFLQ